MGDRKLLEDQGVTTTIRKELKHLYMRPCKTQCTFDYQPVDQVIA